MGHEMRAVDWAATPLGPTETWPLPLRSAVELCLGTSFPVLVTWGPDLTMIYNDGYRELLGTQKRDVALGGALAEVWSDVWDDIRPDVELVLREGASTWVEDQRLVMHRSGVDEETFFTYSYSPLLDEDGTVRGLLDIATETTAQVVERRRTRLLSHLQLRLQASEPDVAAVTATAVEVLDGGTDVARVRIALGTRDDLRWTDGGPDAVETTLTEQVLATGDVREDGRLVVVPLPLAGLDDRVGVVAITGGPLRPHDPQMRAFARLVADVLATSLVAAVRHERQVAALAHVSAVLQRAMLEPHPDRADVATRYVPATRGLEVGGDWFDVGDLPGAEGARVGVVVGDVVGHGLESATRMGQLRSAARALLLRTQDAASTVGGLDAFAAMLPGAEFTTVHCGVLDHAAGTYTYTSAGHPPGVVVHRDGGLTWLTDARGTPLTVARVPRTCATVPVGPGDLLVLCTDGLLERRGANVRDRLDELGAVLHGLRGQEPDAVADALLARMTPQGSHDDTVVVVHRVGG